MDIDLIKFSKFHILQIGNNNFYIYDPISTEPGYITRNQNNEILYTDTTITFSCNSFETKYNIGSTNILKLKQKLQQLGPSIPISLPIIENKVDTYKLLLLGDPGVGKTSLINKHFMGNFIPEYIPTAGVTMTPLTLNPCEIKTLFKVWDFGGNQLNSDSIRHFDKADCAIIMFSVDNKLSYENCNKWYDLLKRETRSIPIILCGNKCDIPSVIDVNWDVRKKYAAYYAVSAKTGYDYEKPFYELANILN